MRRHLGGQEIEFGLLGIKEAGREDGCDVRRVGDVDRRFQSAGNCGFSEEEILVQKV